MAKRVRQATIVRAFAERLRATRLSRQMTQRDLAERAHVTLTYISRLEAGGAAPGLDLLERLANALQVSVPDLLPVPSQPETQEARQQQVRELFEAVLRKAGQDTLTMLSLFFARLLESPASNR